MRNAEDVQAKRLDVALLFALGLASRLVAWLILPASGDWDALFYGAVAANLASGRGAVLDGLPSLAWLPPSLPAPALAYWMPGAPLFYAIGALVSPEHGPTLLAIGAAALLGPLAYVLAEGSGADQPTAIGAGALAAIGGVWAPVLGTSDAHALVALAGGLAWLAAARGSVGGAVAGVAAVALIRNDGLLLAPFVAACFPGAGRRALIAGVGPAVAVAWLAVARVWLGPDALAARAIAVRSSDYADVWDGRIDAPLALGARLAGVLAHGSVDVVVWIGTLGLGLAVPALIAGVVVGPRWQRAAAAAAIAIPLAEWTFAPAVASHGTLYRTGACLLVPAAVAIATGADALGAWSKRARDYPGWLIPAISVGGHAALALALYARATAGVAPNDADCALVAGLSDRPVFTSRPLPVLAVCGHPAVMLTRTTAPDLARDVADRYGICEALVNDGLPDEASVDGADIERILGWQKVGPRTWRRADCPP